MYIFIVYIILVKRNVKVGIIKFFDALKDISYAHQGCIYLLKKL